MGKDPWLIAISESKVEGKQGLSSSAEVKVGQRRGKKILSRQEGNQLGRVTLVLHYPVFQ